MPDEQTRDAEAAPAATEADIATKLAALRGPAGGYGPSRGEMSWLTRVADGLMMMHQAPRVASDSVMPLSHMVRQLPSTRRHQEFAIKVGDPAVDFSLPGSNGETLTLDSVRGRPFAMRLTRAVGSGVI